MLTIILYSYSDTFIIHSEKIEEKGNVFWILTACKDGYQYTIAKSEPIGLISIVQDFEQAASIKSKPMTCQMDFKHESQLDK